MRYGTRSSAGWGTNNNVNICININKNEESSVTSSTDIVKLQNKISTLTSDVDLLKSNVSDLSSLENFEQKLNNYFNTEQIVKIKSLINDDSYNILRNYISQFEQFNSLLEPNRKLTYKETIVILNEYNSSALITAQIGLDTFILNDISDIDNNEDTKFKIPVSGFIIGVEFYCTSDLNSRKELLSNATTSYDSSTKSSYLLLGEDEIQDIYNRAPNNKIIIHSLVIE